MLLNCLRQSILRQRCAVKRCLTGGRTPASRVPIYVNRRYLPSSAQSTWRAIGAIPYHTITPPPCCLKRTDVRGWTARSVTRWLPVTCWRRNLPDNQLAVPQCVINAGVADYSATPLGICRSMITSVRTISMPLTSGTLCWFETDAR